MDNTQPVVTSELWNTSEDIVRSYRTAPCLTVAWHPDSSAIGRQILLRPGRSIILGRGAMDLGEGMLEDRRLSRRHVEISIARTTVHVRDLLSLNGTQVNGQNTTAEVLLQPGDRLQLGPVTFLFHHSLPEHMRPNHRHLVGHSAAIAAVVQAIDVVAPYETTVLVRGESGTGKELIARSLHEESGRRGPFLQVNCGGLSDTLLQSELFGHTKGAFSGAGRDRQGLFQAAEGGTLLLDEIGDASPRLQAALLRVLQEGEVRPVGSNQVRHVDTRIVAATHRDLEAMVAAGEFREDLYARLSGWTLELPPLRERPEDIIPLALHFARQARAAEGLSRSLAERLLTHDWPRNVRELEMVVRRCAIESSGRSSIRLSGAVARGLRPTRPGQAVVPDSVSGAGRTPMDADGLRKLLVESRGNMKRVAMALGVARTTAYRWVKSAGLDVDDFRRGGEETCLDFG
ncbi:MAG: transcriptional regulator with GAF, ATPase, and Fis domain [Myxococcota bacterium]|jgi:transcriptional regulator with GAF, ATPase, and Fis domain